MENLKITFKMKTPVALGYPWIFFDGLIAHLLVKEELGEEYYRLSSKIPSELVADIVDSRMPIKKWKDLFVASVSVFDGDLQCVFNYYKRGDFPFPKGKIRRGSGFFKDFNLKNVYIPAKSVVFYVTGEAGEICKLLKKIVALGKDRNIGFGFVREVAVEETEEECGLVNSGICMRPIPIKYLATYEDSAYIAYKPPYWSKENVELCSVPFTRCTLKN